MQRSDSKIFAACSNCPPKVTSTPPHHPGVHLFSPVTFPENFASGHAVNKDGKIVAPSSDIPSRRS
jgi:hypothetical protein